MLKEMDCPFCARISRSDVVLETALSAAFADGFPVANGHTLIVPKRHEADFFCLRPEERQDMLALTERVQVELARSQQPDGFNVGINIGQAAGQTVAHAHLHLIPRYRGDVADPRGGVRWVLPTKAAYWGR